MVITEKNETTLATSEVSFTWSINQHNRPPIIEPPVIGTIIKNQYFEVDVDGDDPDGDPSVFTATGRSVPSGFEFPDTVSIDPVTGLISGFFPEESEGEYNVFVGLAECSVQTPEPPCDGPALQGSRLATVYNITFTVIDNNQPPTVNHPGDQENFEGETVTLALAVSDPDGDEWTVEAGGLPPGLNIDSETAVISGTVAAETAGTYAVTVVADDHVNPEKRTVAFNWVIKHTNRPPVINVGPFTNVEGTEDLVQAVTGTDADGDTLTYTATNLPRGLLMDTAGTVTGDLDFQSAGVYAVTVNVSDGHGGQVSTTFNWTVTNVNRRPTFHPEAQLNAEGDLVSVLLAEYAEDLDGDTLQYFAHILPEHLTLNSATGEISGLLSYTSAGTYTVQVGVSDGDLAASASFTWTVTENHPPVVINPGTQNSAEGEIILLPIVATDLDLQPLTFTALGLPPGLTMNALGVITGTLPFNAAGTYTVTVTASDGALSDSETFTWNVANTVRIPIALPDLTSVTRASRWSSTSAPTTSRPGA